jgi:hypothetical protein
MSARRRLLAIWILFLARAFFYCAALPIWEGYDEWSHFAVVQRMAFRGELLVSRDAPIGRDIAASLELAPVAWECRYLPPPSLTHDVFWRLPAAERARRESVFRAIPPSSAREDASGNLRAYEGLQGPLYGWLMSPLLRAARAAALPTQLLLLRCFGVVLASLVIPLSFRIGRAVFGEDALGLGCAAIVAVMPEFLIDAARAGNDGIAVLLFTAAIWLSLEILRDGVSTSRALKLGAVVGLGLLAKAYFLAALPPIAVLLLWKCRGLRALLVPLLASVIAGWWYIRNAVTTGAATGMWESALRSNAGLGDQLHQVSRIPWGVAIDAIMLSHLYFGAWSNLTVRSWMYHLFYAWIVLAALGLASQGRRLSPPVIMLAAFLVSFWLGELYHVIPMFTVWAVPASMGCYLYAVVAAEVALCAAGLRNLAPQAARRLVAPAGVVLFALLDLYTIHMVAIPYYTGMIAHRLDGPVAAFHPATAPLAEILPRLVAFKSPLLTEPVLVALWIAYAASTLALIAVSFWIARTPPLPASHTAAASPAIAASGPTIPAPPPPTAAH